MSGPITAYLVQDHERLGTLLNHCLTGSDTVALRAYNAFRAGLLRHIGMEEKILLPAARRMRGGEALPAAELLKLDHAALALLLVPTPTRSILEVISSILVEHNKLEEGPHGVYETCEELAGNDAQALAEQLRSAPAARVAPHYDTPLVHEHIRQLLEARAAGAK